jgi:hypothetical protein
MAIVVYKCDVCKREIERIRNPKGLDTIQKCIITHGCRGKLYQIKVLEDYSRGSFPEDVSGLDNWLQRKVLYNHNQAIERTEWIITHNLGTLPAIQVFVNRPIEGNEDNQEEIQPLDIILVDNNTIKVVFDRKYAGIAQLTTRQSDPNLLNPVTPTSTAETTFQQISNNGEITIATRISTVGTNVNTNIKLLFNTTQGSTPTISFNADDQPALDSAWNDFNTIILKGKIYTVRSFNAITSEMTSGIIGNGSTFVFSAIDPISTQAFRNITSDEVILLTANSPYSTFDKIVDKYVDVSDSSSDATVFDFFYDSGEFFVQSTIIQSIYPHIRSI